MNEEILDTLNELSKKPITELAMSYMEIVVDNMVKDKEIDRLNKIIDEIDRISTTNYQTNIYTGSIDFKRGYNEGSKFFQEFLRNKLKELKEEGKFQEIPLFEGTMEQLDNLTILNEEGK